MIYPTKMRRKILLLVLPLLIIVVLAYAYKNRRYFSHVFEKRKESFITKNEQSPVLATFSFRPGYKNQLVDKFPHFTLYLFDNPVWNIDRYQLTEIPDSIPVLITVETWTWKRIAFSYKNPLEALEEGGFDKAIRNLCEKFIGERPNVYLRLNPEMEVPVTVYPWQYFGPDYITPFRHFAETCKKYAPQVKIVWGPAGYPGTMEFYPGDDVVDAISVTLKSDSEQLLDVYPKDLPLETDLFRRLHRLRFTDKPLLVLGSRQVATGQLETSMLKRISERIDANREIVYSPHNFIRTDSNGESTKREKKVLLGVYDPQSLLNAEPPVDAEHLFVDFERLATGKFETGFRDVISRGHDVIVTFEPFRLPGGEKDLNVLENILSGKYDSEISKLYSIISGCNRTVYLRYAHEMEIPIHRYPWQSCDPMVYIHSFRYFMNFPEPFPANIRRVWGPAGDRGSLEWYPGDDVVDFMSIAIYGLPDKNITDPNLQESFETIFKRKSWRLRFVNKPLFITEFGVKGPEEYQTHWMLGAARVISENPQIHGVSYFNMTDTPKAWGEIKPPDWSITKQTFYRFVQALTGSTTVSR